jgi:hypothetical protein
VREIAIVGDAPHLSRPILLFICAPYWLIAYCRISAEMVPGLCTPSLSGSASLTTLYINPALQLLRLPVALSGMCLRCKLRQHAERKGVDTPEPSKARHKIPIRWLRWWGMAGHWKARPVTCILVENCAQRKHKEKLSKAVGLHIYTP